MTIEYTLIDGMNDHADHAEALAKLLRDLPCKINLIPFNPSWVSFSQTQVGEAAIFPKSPDRSGLHRDGENDARGRY